MTPDPIEQAIEAFDAVDETLSFIRNMMNEPDEIVALNIPSFKEDMDAMIKALRTHGATIRTALRQHQQDGGWRDISTCPDDTLCLFTGTAFGTRFFWTSRKINNYYGASLPQIVTDSYQLITPPAPKKENDDGTL